MDGTPFLSQCASHVSRVQSGTGQEIKSYNNPSDAPPASGHSKHKANMSNTKTSHEEAYINLSKEEEADLISSIEEAKQRLSQFHRPITWKEALSLLRETVGPAWWRMMKNHKSERMLN